MTTDEIVSKVEDLLYGRQERGTRKGGVLGMDWAERREVVRRILEILEDVNPGCLDCGWPLPIVVGACFCGE